VTGDVLGGGGLTPAIQNRIKESDALVALFTREERIANQDEWRPTEWVSNEYISARSRNQLAIAVVEDGVRLNGAYAENEYIRLDPTRPCEAIVQLSETIGIWKIESGRSLEIRLLPEAAATVASDEHARCEYRLVSPSGDSTEWRVTKARRKPGGVFLIIQGIKLDQAIEIQILEGNNLKWRSVESPQWVHVELKSMP
jgi:hypothetical protein